MILPTGVPPQMVSPRVQELGQKLALAISEFRQRYPDASDDEIRQAARLATNPASGAPRVGAGLMAALVAALLAGGGLVWLDSSSAGGGHLGVDLAAGVVALLAVVVLVRSRASRT